MTTREQVNALADGLSHLATLAKRDLREFFAALAKLEVDAARAALHEYLPLQVERYGDMAAALAADWYDAQRAEDPDDFRAQVYPGSPQGAVAARADSASSHLLRSQPDLALAALLDALDRYVKQPARTTIVKNGLADPKRPRFARVPRGATTCEFCVMLASRGAVYLTRETAGELNKWHGQCDCQIVPADKLPRGYDPDALLEQWRAIQAAKTAPGQPVRHTPKPLSEHGKVENPHGVHVDPHEAVAHRRLEALGLSGQLRAIIQGQKNPDLEVDGASWELKCPKGAGASVVSDQFKRARKQSERLVIDLHRCPRNEATVVDEAGRRFAGQNAIRELWVILKDGSAAVWQK